MYFPVGWPKYLSVGQGRKSPLKSIVCNRYRMLFAVLTETTISIWHCRPCVEIVCYQRCHASVASIGTNELAEWRQDSSMLAVTTTGGCLLLYQLEQDVKGERGLSLYEYDQTKTNQGDSNDSVPALRLSLKSNVNFKCSITSLSFLHDELLVTLKDGRLELISWESPTNGRKSIALGTILFSVDMNVSGSHIKSKNVYPVQVTDYSPFLDGFAIVLSDGHAGLVAVAQAEVEDVHNQPEESHSSLSMKGIWAPGINNATCVAVNNKYRLLAFGTEKGDCNVFAIDDVTGCLSPSHTIVLSATHYPNIHNSVGSVLKIDWSPDGCALALSWSRGGISIWSVFGACLVCTLASDRACSVDGTLNIQGIFKSMRWGVEGYHLWLISESSPSTEASSSSENEHSEQTATPGSLHVVQDAENKKKRHFKRFRKKSTSNNDTNSTQDYPVLDLGQLLQVQFVKSALAMNPCMSNHCHVLLHSEDRMYLSMGEKQQKTLFSASNNEKRNNSKKIISTHVSTASLGSDFKPPRSVTLPRRRSLPPTPSETKAVINNNLVSVPEEAAVEEQGEEDHKYSCSAVGNKQWTVIQFPVNYLPSNWPIRFAVVDETGCYLAIAGNNGLAHYNVASRKWKVFGNVTQEKDMVVTGGLTWWQEFVVVACYNLPENADEIRLYPRNTNLDNAFACIRKIRSQILLVNVFQNLLILFTYDCRISIFIIERDAKVPMASLCFVQDVSMACYVRYPTLVASVTMSALHIETSTRRLSSSASVSSRPQRETEVIIVNVAGRLLLLQRSLEDDDLVALPATDEELTTFSGSRKQMTFNSPIVLASCVENIWSTHHKNRSKVHLTDALWLGCGGAGIRVWLPLFPPNQSRHSSRGDNNHRGFELQLLTARRITLTFSLDSCYPLAVLFNEAVILGVTSETLEYQGFHKSSSKRRSHATHSWFHFSTIERTTEIYLHQIFRQLLRGNLGYNALQLADTCKNLSCFAHVLELMLHEVLEEEATASEPIPDPLLPTVIKFLEKFPEYLQTVVHCARKTEIALWEYLFNSVGSPRELFEECLGTNQLRTAASYLIILQNLEQLSVARHDATRLFDKALQHEKWELANDIARFLRAIGDGDASATPRHPTLLNTNIYPALAPVSMHSTTVDAEPPFKYSDERKTLVMRQYSMAPSYYEKSLGQSASGNVFSKDSGGGSSGVNTSTKRASTTRSAPSTPAVTIGFPGYNATSINKMQGSNQTLTEEASSTPTTSRRLATRSYTESHFELRPNKTSPSVADVTSPTGSNASSSQAFTPRYSTRNYRQDNPLHRPLQHSISLPMSNNKSKRFSGDKDVAQTKEHAAADCAEHYFIDVILARQARKMLSERQLHKLGTFAAYVDFQLVPWLRKERGRAARVDDAVSCFESLHSDFDWPYPTIHTSKSGRSSNGSGGTPTHSQSCTDLDTLRSVSPRSSNFSNSTSFGPRNLVGSSSPVRSGLPSKRVSDLADSTGFGTDEDAGSGIVAMLSAKEMGGSTLTLTTVASEASYTFDDYSFGACTEDLHGNLLSDLEVDEKRGSPRSEMKLMYLLELFLEALCLEWAIMICIMLRDPSAMARLVRCTSPSENQTAEDDATYLNMLQRTRHCLQQIDQWAVSECPGYKAVLIHMRNHIQSLYDIINAKEVAHAEQQAIFASQQLSHSNSASERSMKSSHSAMTTSSVSSSSSIKATAVKRLFSPGTAISVAAVADDAVNGDAELPHVSEDESDREKPEMRLVRKVNRQESQRTRHNSLPSENTLDPVPLSESIHERTPSSPAKINFFQQQPAVNNSGGRGGGTVTTADARERDSDSSCRYSISQSETSDEESDASLSDEKKVEGGSEEQEGNGCLLS